MGFEDRVAALAQVPVLLVASDYDGTLAPIVSDPTQAHPLREAMVALRRLADMPQTHVAIISGRALRDLAALVGVPDEVHLVGSHGSEFDLDFAATLPAQAAQLRARVLQELKVVVGGQEGFIIEEKPASIAFHYRNVADDQASEAVDRVTNGPGSWEGVFTSHGKKVVELGVITTNKGSALEVIRHRVGASAVIFLGDDRTDEAAFATLTGPDIAVKVGEGESCASFRVTDSGEVAQVLARLCELRLKWLSGSKAVPIEQHSILSDQRTVALVSPDANITWFCAPCIDSSALFADLVGGPTAGYFSITDEQGREPIEQTYLEASLVLRSRWADFSVTDFMDCSGGRPSQRAGRADLIRIVEGKGTVKVVFCPRLDFGRVSTCLKARDGGLEIDGSQDPIVLRSPGVTWRLEQEGAHHIARTEIDLTSKSRQVFELSYGTGSLRESGSDASDRLQHTQRFWSSWAKQLTLPDIAQTLVQRSALVLKSLCYGPTGAIAAAATTSLPEHVGGIRNWDYRYCWLRDGAMSASALVKLGSYSEAMHFLDWVLGVLDHCASPERLHPLYAVNGAALGPEAEIAELTGYRGSRPVRVGNSATQQVQLDVFGPVVDLVFQLLERDAPLSSMHWRLVEALVGAVERRWREPDHGIWEIRRPRRHHVHSKVMCWTTVDRGIKIARRFLDRDRSDWADLRDDIAADVLSNGYKQDVGAFTAAYDGVDLDASALCVGLFGLLPPDDKRFTSTVGAIEEHLLNGPTVYRYRSDDGLPGFEGGFHICTAWMVDAYILLGRTDDARRLFEAMAALAGPTGMLSEQYGPKTKRALGNTPQAYSHVGVIESALRLARIAQE